MSERLHEKDSRLREIELLVEELRSGLRQRDYESEGWKIKIKDLEEDLAYQNERNGVLLDQNRKLQIGITSSSGDKSVIESKLTELQYMVQRFEQDKQDSANDIAKLKGINSDLLSQLRAKEDELTALRNSYDQSQAQSNVDIKRVQDSNSELKIQNEKLHNDLQTSITDTLALRRNKELAERKSIGLEGELESQQSLTKALKDQVERLTDEIQALQQTNHKLQAERDLLKQRPEKIPDNSGLLNKIRTLESINQNLQGELDQSLSMLKTQENQFQRKLAERSSSSQALADELKSLREENQNLRLTQINLESESSRLASLLKDAQKQCDEAEGIIRNLSRDVKFEHETANNYKVQIEELKRTLEAEVRNSTSFRTELGQLQNNLRGHQDTVQQLQNALNNSNSEISRLKLLIEELNSELQNQKDKNEMLRSENDEMEQKVSLPDIFSAIGQRMQDDHATVEFRERQTHRGEPAYQNPGERPAQ